MKNFKECTVESSMRGIKGFGEACIKAAKDLDNNMQKINKNFKVYVDDNYEVNYIIKYTIRFIDLLNTLSQHKELPKKIVYNDIVYTNVSRTKMNLLYYCLEEDYSVRHESNIDFENLRIFKQVMSIRKSGETDIDILNREIGVIEW